MGTYTYDLTTDVGKMRMYLQDFPEGKARFTNEELTMFATEAGSWQRGIADAAGVLLMNVARFARVFTDAEGNTIDETAGAEYLQDLIDKFGGGTTVIPRVSVTNLGRYPSDPSTT